MTLTRKKKALLILSALVAAPIACTGAGILWVGLHDRIEPADAAIVLGSAVDENGAPSRRLAARLDKAVELYQRNLFKKVIVSGGVDSYGHDEAQVMAHYLREHGVAAGDVLLDNDGRNTWLTAQNSARILREHKLHSVMVITQYFHIARTELALGRCGVQCAGHAHANLFELRDVYSMAREICGYCAYLMKS